MWPYDPCRMGYEFEAGSGRETIESGWHGHALAQRWQRADSRLAAALRDYALLRRSLAADEPELIAAQLNVAQARLRWRECAEEAENLASLPDLQEAGT
jgi:hypothetical protein